MSALLGRIEADIWSGHYREVTGELDVLFAENPDDGAVPRLLATSLYLSERSAEADDGLPAGHHPPAGARPRR
jgi:hypothetical protein